MNHYISIWNEQKYYLGKLSNTSNKNHQAHTIYFAKYQQSSECHDVEINT